MKKLFALIVASVITLESGATPSLKAQDVPDNGVVPRHGYMPKDGFVPDKETAIAIAVAVLVPIYGTKLIEDEKPFTATLRNQTWVVEGRAPKGPGGAAEVDLSKATGKILRVIHYK